MALNLRTSKFSEYVDQRDNGTVGQPAPFEDGEDQRDPDQPNQTQELLNAMQEIISIAHRALEKRQKGLADKNGNNKPPEESPDNANNLVSRPKADTAADMFGQDGN